MRPISARRRFTCVVEPIESRLLLSATLALHGPAAAKGNVSSDLLALAAAPAAGRASLAVASGDGGLVVDGGKVALKITARDAGDVPSLQTELSALGFVEATHYAAVLIGAAPIDAVSRLGAAAGVASVAPAYAPRAFAGVVDTQGDTALRAAIARNSFGVDGSGIKVGVISDSFDQASGSEAVDDVNSGDLPDFDHLDILDDSLPGEDEGRAMMQLIHDIAPGAALAFHTAGTLTGAGPVITDATIAQAIVALADAGCDVIVDDIGGPDEPMYLDGLAAQAVDQVSAQGVVYFCSAANGGRTGYESAFDDSGVEVTVDGRDAGRAHDFDPGPGVDTGQSVTVPSGAAVTIEFQWDEPFRSITGTASASDIDIYLVEPTTGSVVAIGGQDNTASGVGDPFEVLGFVNSTPFNDFDVVIARFSGPSPGRMKYVNRQSVISIDEFDTQSPTLFGHQNSTLGAAVGAAPWFQTPQFGVDPAVKESFSSVGGTPILFNTEGERLAAPQDRLQPRFTSTDGGNTTFFVRDSAADSDDFPNFFGTSAAAPEAAAVAALMLQRDHSATPQEIISTLQSTALDMDDPDLPGFQTGRDDATGAGLIQADAAVTAISGGLKTTAASVSGTAWTAGFKNFLADRGLGDAQNGFALGVSNDDAPPLPWTNLDRVAVRFNRAVAVVAGDARVTSNGGKTYAVQSLTLDPAGTTATLRLTQPLTAGRVRVEFNINGQSSGDTRVEFDVLPGDVNRNGGAVQASDLVVTRNLTGRSTTNPGSGATAYSPFADVNADGVVNATDLVQVRNRIGSRALAAPSLLRDDAWLRKEREAQS